jgi:hypothetical protein
MDETEARDPLAGFWRIRRSGSGVSGVPRWWLLRKGAAYAVVPHDTVSSAEYLLFRPEEWTDPRAAAEIVFNDLSEGAPDREAVGRAVGLLRHPERAEPLAGQPLGNEILRDVPGPAPPASRAVDE